MVLDGIVFKVSVFALKGYPGRRKGKQPASCAEQARFASSPSLFFLQSGICD